MKKLIALFAIIQMVLSLVYLRLSTQDQNQLMENDFVSSTLGNYRFSLVALTCQLKLEAFVAPVSSSVNNNIGQSSTPQSINNSSATNMYRTLGYYPNTTNQNCDFLVLKKNGLMTVTGGSFLTITIPASSKGVVKQTYVTIDDTGVIRLVCINIDSTTTEQWITMYRQPQPFIATTNNIIATMQNSLSIRANYNNWGFSASNGQFRVFNLNDLTKITKYKYTGFTITPTNLIDSDNFKPPLSKFWLLKYQKRCGISTELAFRTPYVFIMHPYWPELRILDQTGYELINIRFPRPQCLQLVGVDKLQNVQSCTSWICPKQTFELNGKCITRCPFPYYHQIRQNSINRCVLMCEAGSIMNNDTFTCFCTQKPRIQCQSPLVPSPLGCLCSNNTFFTNLNILTPNSSYSCVSKCPPRFYQLQQGPLGICISCPIYCINCKPAITNVTFLTCIACESQFDVSSGICIKKCESKLGYILIANTNGSAYSCVSCQIPNCKICAINTNTKTNTSTININNFTCLACSMPYVLFTFNNSCLNQCPSLYIMRFNQTGSNFYCDRIADCSSIIANANTNASSNSNSSNNNNNVSSSILGSSTSSTSSVLLQVQTCKKCEQYFCWISCQANTFFHNQSKCFCQSSALTLAQSYIPSCQKQIQQNCTKINHYFNSMTNQCMKCPFGCLTCDVDQTGYVQCTSCGPMYYLSISIYQNHDCQRETSLVYCNGIYDRNRKFCVSKDFQSLLISYKDRTSCLNNTSNCLICLYKSQQICTFCQSGYYLHEGTCIESCPSGYYPYQFQFVCLKKTFENCQVQSPSSVNFLLSISSQTQYVSGYSYFITQNFVGFHNLNDPVGQIFIYFALLKKNLAGNRTSLFNYAEPTCKVCSDGFGWDQLGKCKKCQNFCLKCINSYDLYCLVCHPYYKITSNNTCQILSDSQRPCMGSQYRNQQGVCVNECPYFYRIELKNSSNSRSINCTYNCPNNWLIIKYNLGLACILPTYENQSKSPYQMNALLDIANLTLDTKTKISSETIQLMGSWFQTSSSQSVYVFSPTFDIRNLSTSDFTVFTLKNISNSNNKNASLSLLLPVSLSLSLSGSNNNRVLFNNISSSQGKVRAFTSENKIIIISNSNQSILLSINTSKVSAINSRDQSIIYMGNSIYSLSSSISASPDGSVQSTNVLDMIINNGNGFYHYGRMFIILFLLIAIINLGKGIYYKLDNIFITFSVIYLILPSTNIVLDKGSYNAYNFLYGFAWSCGLQMFSNPRYMTYNSNFIPNNYIQQTSNNAHALLFIDDNVVRNGWSAILLMFVMIVLWVVVFLLTVILTKRVETSCFLKCLKTRGNEVIQAQQCQVAHQEPVYANTQSQLKSKFQQKKPSNFFRFKKYDPQDADHLKVFTNFTFFIVDNCVIGLVYYSVLTINSKAWDLASQSQMMPYIIISIAFLILTLMYFGLRLYTSRIGGVYIGKRVAFGIILAFISMQGGIDTHLGLAFLLFLIIQLFFIAFRIYYENWRDIQQIFLHFQKRQKSMIQVTFTNSGSRDNLKSLQTDQVPRTSKASRKNLPDVMQQRKENTMQNQAERQSKCKMFEGICSIPVSHQLKILFFEQFLIIIVEMLAILNYYAVELFVFIVVIVLCIFLVILTDEIFQDLIKISIISEKQQKMKHMRIRTSFDYQFQPKQKSINSTQQG